MDPEPLILPPSLRLLRPDEVPPGSDHDNLRAEVARGQAAVFTTGYVLRHTRRPEFPVYAEVNVHAPILWRLFRDLCVGLLPERAALMIGIKDDEVRSCAYHDKRSLLDGIEPYGDALARDAFVQFGLIWQLEGETEEVFVEPARYLKVWTSRGVDLERILRDHGIPRMETMAFIDEFPRVTDITRHPPELDTYVELIQRVRAAEEKLPILRPLS